MNKKRTKNRPGIAGAVCCNDKDQSLQQAQYSFATAVGLFNSVVNFILLVLVNFVSKRFSDISVF